VYLLLGEEVAMVLLSLNASLVVWKYRLVAAELVYWL
jgi:hypothetical protein